MPWMKNLFAITLLVTLASMSSSAKAQQEYPGAAQDENELSRKTTDPRPQLLLQQPTACDNALLTRCTGTSWH